MNFNRELIGSVTCIRLTAPEGATAQQAVNIIVVLDVSGSMNDGSKLTNVLLSLEQLLTYLRDDDVLTVVPFSDGIRRPFPIHQEPCTTTGKALIQEKLARITANGNTHLEAAIRSGSEVLALPLTSRSIKSAVLLLTDGAATVGELDHTKLVEFQAANLAAYPDALFCTVGY
jgi:Mg-chelatase subunit ChlD